MEGPLALKRRTGVGDVSKTSHYSFYFKLIFDIFHSAAHNHQRLLSYSVEINVGSEYFTLIPSLV